MKKNKLIYWRISNNYKQYEVAKEMGVTKQYYNGIENGRFTPSTKFISKFKKTYNIDNADELFEL